jgi:hypothetical protein
MANHSAGPANHHPPGAGDVAEPDAGAVSPAALGPAPRRGRLARLFGGGLGGSDTPPSPPPSCPHCGHTPPPPPRIVGADDAPPLPFLRRFERKTVWKVGDPAPLFNPTFSDAYGRPWRYDKDLLRWICEADSGLIVDSSPDFYELVARLGPLTLR